LLNSLIIDDAGAMALLEMPQNTHAANSKAKKPATTTKAIRTPYEKKKGLSGT
jgi:hypothetical protein